MTINSEDNNTDPSLDNLSKIAKGLKEARISTFLSQNMLGRAVGVTFQQWQKYETGENTIPLKRLIITCQFLNINIGDFLNKCIYNKDQSKKHYMQEQEKIWLDLIIAKEQYIRNLESQKKELELQLVSLGFIKEN